MSDGAINWLLVIGFLASGGAFLGYTIWMLRAARMSLHWPTADGTITASDVILGRTGKGGKAYSPGVRYSYSVDGTDYQGDGIQFGSSGIAERTAKAIVAAFPVGKRVPVYYDPQRPTRTVLMPGVTGWPWTLFLLFCGGILTLLGLFMVALLVLR